MGKKIKIETQKIINIDWRIGTKEIENKSVDLVLTDPPYGIDFQSNFRRTKHKKIHNDNTLEWLDEWCKELKRVTKEDAHLYIFCSWHNVEVFKKGLQEFFKIKNILIWKKNNTSMGDLKGDYAPQYEMILFCTNGKKKLKGRRDSNILKSPRTQNVYHPTEKPINLISYLIEKSTNKGDLVLDTFGGSCSTAIASKQTGRSCICFEIDKEYCTIANKRLMSTSEKLF